MKSWIGPLSLLALIAALVVVGSAGASHRATSPVKESFKYCSDPTFPPMESTTTAGKPVGFDVDMANAIAKLWKVKAKFVQTAFPGLLPALQSKQLQHGDQRDLRHARPRQAVPGRRVHEDAPRARRPGREPEEDQGPERPGRARTSPSRPGRSTRST